MTINYQMPGQLEGFQGDDSRLLNLNVDKKLKEKQTKPWFWVKEQSTQRSWKQEIKNIENNWIWTPESKKSID